MQRILLVFLAVLGMLMWCGAVEADDCADCCEPFIRGDVDGDGDVDVDDVSTFSSCDSTSSCPNTDVYDIEDDGDVDRNDLYKLYGHVYYNDPATLPAPFPYEGYDWTPDGMGSDCDVAPTSATQGFDGPCTLTRTTGKEWTDEGCNGSGGGGNGMATYAAHKPYVTKDECTDDHYWETWSKIKLDADHGTGHDSKNEFTVKQLCGRDSSGDGIIKMFWFFTATSQIKWLPDICESCYTNDYNHTTSDWSDVTFQFVFRPVSGSTHYSYYVDEINLHETSKWISQRVNEYPACENYNPSNQHIPGTGWPVIDMADVADEFCHVYSLDEDTKIVLDHIYIHDWRTIWDDHDTGHDLCETWELNLQINNYGVDYKIGAEDWQGYP